MRLTPFAVILGSLGAEIPTVEINTGVHMPLMMQGTPGKGFPEDVVRSALEVGYVGIDSAFNDPSYQTDGLRKVLKTVDRNKLFITSKINGPYVVHPDEAENEMDAALRDLGIDYVDLMLSHGPGVWQNWTVESSLQRYWAGFESFYKAGKARAIGVSNWCPRAIRSILKTATVTPHVNQVVYHAGMGEDPDGLMSFSRQYGITIQCESASDWANPIILSGEPYASIGQKHNKSGIQVAFRWLVQRGYPALQGSSSQKHQAEDMDIFDFELAEDDMKTISAQEHCRAGFQRKPHCHVPYFYSRNRICNLDLKGALASNWECDDFDALMRTVEDRFIDWVTNTVDIDPILYAQSCSEWESKCNDPTLGSIVREHCKSTCQQPCQVGPSDQFV